MPQPSWQWEKEFWKQGYANIAGIDEAGRGAWAGPLVAAAVIWPPYIKNLEGINDSKLLTPRQREKLIPLILSQVRDWSIAFVPASLIDKKGITKATEIVFQRVLKQLNISPDFVLVDGYHVRGIQCPQQPLIKGDQQSFTIAAASILAKVFRDWLMVTEYDSLFPDYQFARHKGYGTRQHQQALRCYGLSPWHRRSYLKNFFASLEEKNIIMIK